jgi:transposase-like protein
VPGRTLRPEVAKHVESGATIYTDELASHKGLDTEYAHMVINHAEAYAKGHVHTNGMENLRSLLKRGIRGTYVSVEPFHLFRYLDEAAFRFNTRKDNDAGRFLRVVASVAGKRLEFKNLIGEPS